MNVAARGCNLLLSGALAFGAAACTPPGAEAEEVLFAYMTAVQEVDRPTLFCLSAGAASSEDLGSTQEARQRAFGRWADGHYQQYLDGRDAGLVRLDGSGIVLVKLLSLGRGTFFTIASEDSIAEDTREVVTHLNLGYGRVDLSRLTPGTTFYLPTTPVGRVEPVRVPEGGKEIEVEVLDEINLRWILARQPAAAGCEPGWTVVSVEPMPGSVRTLNVRLVF